MTILSPIRLDRFQRALVEVLDGALGADASVGWAYGEALWDDNFPTGNLVNLTLVQGPTFHTKDGAAGSVLIPPTVVGLVVDVATVGVRYVTVINDYSYFYDAIALDTVDDIRTGLVAAIVADTESPYTAAATGAPGGYTVTPDATGSIWQMSVSVLQTATPTLNTQAVLKVQGTRRMSVAVGCFSKGRSPRTGAWDIAARCQAAFTSPQYAQTFSRYGVGVWGKGPAVDLSDLAGGHWESRVSFDVDFAMQSTHTEAVGQVETIHTTLNIADPALTQTFTVTKP